MNSDIDPNDATTISLSRGAFVGISAAAAAVATGAAPGRAETFGQPHPPLVAEDDPAIVVDRVQLRRLDAVVPAYAAWPTNPRPDTPTIVVIMHVWGVDANIRDVVRRFAKAGYRTIAPDLYARFGAPSGDGITDIDVVRPFAKQLDRKQYDGDIRAAALWATTIAPNTKVGVTGFCSGGHLTLIQAMDNSDIFAAAAPFYGSLNDVDPDKIHMPICGSYGERDTSIPIDGVRAFRDALRVQNDIRIYSTAGHAFFDDTRPSYVAYPAEDSWKRVLAFFKATLGTS